MITELRQDHHDVEVLLAGLERNDHSPAERRRRIRGITGVLVRHSAVEERHVYPLVRRAVEDGQRFADRGLAQHDAVGASLRSLEETDPVHEAYEPLLATVLRDVRQHMRQEEDELFPLLRRACTPEELAEYGDRVRTARAATPAHLRPPAPTASPGGPVAGLVTRLGRRVRNRLHRT